MSRTVAPGEDRETRLLRAFVDLADTLVDDYDVADVLHQLVGYCVEFLDAAAAGLMLSDQRGSLQVLASSTERTRLLELFQLQANEGPCLDCFSTGEPVLMPDMSTATRRWPQFAPRATEEGFLSVNAIPLRLRQNTIGALNLFSRERGPMDEQDLRVARALADTATIGILQERAIHRGEVLTEQLQHALNNRITIEQAKGLLAHAGDLEMGGGVRTPACLQPQQQHPAQRTRPPAHQGHPGTRRGPRPPPAGRALTGRRRHAPTRASLASVRGGHAGCGTVAGGRPAATHRSRKVSIWAPSRLSRSASCS